MYDNSMLYEIYKKQISSKIIHLVLLSDAPGSPPNPRTACGLRICKPRMFHESLKIESITALFRPFTSNNYHFPMVEYPGFATWTGSSSDPESWGSPNVD